MQQTDQYELNQWDPTDRILREDFNADNLKIAAALAGMLDRTELLFSLDPPGDDLDSSTFNLTIIPWANWEFVLLHAFFKENESLKGHRARVTLNYNIPLGVFPWGDFFLLFWTRHSLKERVRGLFLSPQSISPLLPELTYGELHHLDLDKEDARIPTQRYRFYGIR